MNNTVEKIKAFFGVKKNAVVTAVCAAALAVIAVAAALIFGAPGRYAYAQKYCAVNPQAALIAIENVDDGYKDTAKLRKYTQALLYAENGETQQAIDMLTELDYYKDCRLRVKNLYYELASKQFENGELDAAIENFEKSGISDCSERITETKYQKAAIAENGKDYLSAYELFSSLGDYKDSVDRGFQNAARYAQTLTPKDGCNFIKDVSDALKEAENTVSTDVFASVKNAFNGIRVAYADELMQSEAWQDAIDCLTTVDEDYEPDTVSEKLTYCRSMLIYIDACALMEQEKYVEAIELFDTIAGFLDADELNEECERNVYHWTFTGFLTKDGTKDGETTKFSISDTFYVYGTLSGGKPDKTIALRFVWLDRLGYTATSVVDGWYNGRSGSVSFYYTVPENARAGKNRIRVYNDKTDEMLAEYIFTTK